MLVLQKSAEFCSGYPVENEDAGGLMFQTSDGRLREKY